MLARELTRYERPAPAWPRRLGVFSCALALTAFTALLVPLADLLTKAPTRNLDYRTIELSEWRPPPPPAPLPPPPKPAPPQPPPPQAARASVPRLEAPRPQAPERLRLPVKLDFALGDTRSDLALDFDADPTASALPGVATAPAPPPPPPPPPAAVADNSEPLDRHPAAISQSKPVYPYRARSRRIEGHVDLQFTVSAHGSVDSVIVADAQPQGVFEEAATAAVRAWRFSPGIRDGQPVPVRMQIRIRFDLTE